MNRAIPNNPLTHWKPNGHFLRTAIPDGMYGWLLDPASLTRRLQQLCPGRFRVRVLAQGWDAPRLDEARALGMRAGRRAVIRQVQLLCDDRPWVYARTVIPASSLRGRLRRLVHLGTRPLGAMLFADPGMRRGIVELACIQRGEALYADATRGIRRRPAAIWGRRSVFRVLDKPLLVSEVFLPDLPSGTVGRPYWDRHRWRP